jgi:hypothetical protein
MVSEGSRYQIKVTLIGVKPPIWRRLLVPGALSLKELHHVLQRAFGWDNDHLHQFSVHGRRIPERFRLDEILTTEKEAITYEYDFGDGWEHRVILEKISDTPDASISCIAGARACPPEDCGGVPGYYALLETLSDPSHPEHGRMLEWVRPGFDPERFDISQINGALARLKRRSVTTPSRTIGRKRPAP